MGVVNRINPGTPPDSVLARVLQFIAFLVNQIRCSKGGILIGRVTGAGQAQEITVGAGLQLIGTTLSSSGGAIVSETAPIDPPEGQGWYDPEDGIFAIWDGTVWVGQEFFPIQSIILPILSDVTATPGDGTGLLSATLDQSGMMYFYVSLSPTPEDPADIIAGTGSWLQYDAAVCAAGDPVVLLVSGLTNDVLHYFHAMGVNETGDPSTIEVVSFTPSGSIPPLAFTYLGNPFTYLGEYFTSPV